MGKKVSFKNYSFRDKVCVSGVMFCMALCGIIAADRYVKKDTKGTCAGAIGVGMSTLVAAKCSQIARKKARHKMYQERERG